MQYKTPGVYIKEITTLPPSVAEVSTAVPAFIGYTQTGAGQTARISTMLEYEATFGRAHPSHFTATVVQAGEQILLTGVTRDLSDSSIYILYDSISLYFDNGGGSCYIISVGNYHDSISSDALVGGLDRLDTEDEPTLILFPDAVNLGAQDYGVLCQKALQQCGEQRNRFTIMDVVLGDQAGATQTDVAQTGTTPLFQSQVDVIRSFRKFIGTRFLQYGAAYYPYLQTTIKYSYLDETVSLDFEGIYHWEKDFGENGITVGFTSPYQIDDKVNYPRVFINYIDSSPEFKPNVNDVAHVVPTFVISHKGDETGNEIVAAWVEWSATNDPKGFDIRVNGTGLGVVPDTDAKNGEILPLAPLSLADIQTSQTALYNQIRTALANQRVVLPPSPAIAGVYASVDRERGVWKAPANVSLSSVIGPTVKISNADQELLNVDPTAGKSINAIRVFMGKGTLVWGARTLLGNDNEWRYISVRRLFNTIEKSTQKSTSFAVFESNDATTWLKVKAMIEAYLYELWGQGALAGPTPDTAYFVNIGLGKTMTTQDILEGRMIVEIGVAAVRPAEFIVLTFMQKLQEG